MGTGQKIALFTFRTVKFLVTFLCALLYMYYNCVVAQSEELYVDKLFGFVRTVSEPSSDAVRVKGGMSNELAEWHVA